MIFISRISSSQFADGSPPQGSARRATERQVHRPRTGSGREPGPLLSHGAAWARFISPAAASGVGPLLAAPWLASRVTGLGQSESLAKARPARWSRYRSTRRHSATVCPDFICHRDCTCLINIWNPVPWYRNDGSKSIYRYIQVYTWIYFFSKTCKSIYRYILYILFLKTYTSMY